MEKDIVIGISDMKVSQKPGRLVTYALGSCVGICIHDSKTKISGLSHVLLPEANIAGDGKKPIEIMKYANTAIPELIKRMEQLGASRLNMKAKIVGGAQMFQSMNNSMTGQIGQRNVQAVKEALRKEKIAIIAEDTGANYGRTVFMDVATGTVSVKTAFGKVKDI